MLSNLLPWIVVGAALAAAAVLYSRLRQATTLASSKQIDVDKLLGELKSTREQMERSAAKQRRATDELMELRKKHEKVKKRAARGQGGAPAGTPAQVQTLEADLEQARQARDAARDEALALSGELSRLRGEQVENETPAAPAPLLDNAAIQALQAKVEALEGERDRMGAELAKATDAAERLRHKAKTQDTLYVSMRSELDAKKDRLRSQQEELERLRAMQVVVGAVASTDELAVADESGDAVAESEDGALPEPAGAGDGGANLS
jgi:chromosome segregation ATPase